MIFTILKKNDLSNPEFLKQYGSLIKLFKTEKTS